MGQDFNGQGGHVVDAAVGLRGVSLMIAAAGSFLRPGAAVDLPHLHDVLAGEAGGGLSWPQGDTWERGDAVDFVLSFVRLSLRRRHVQGDGGDVVDLQWRDRDGVKKNRFV